jgi:hypothetical protein
MSNNRRRDDTGHSALLPATALRWLASISLLLTSFVAVAANQQASLAIAAPADAAAPGQTWTQLAPTGGPPSVRYSTSVFDPATKQMIIFGGSGLNVNYNDVWSLTTAGSPRWTLGNNAAVYDPGNARLIVFGGQLGSASPCANDSWVLTNANGVSGTPTWTNLARPGPHQPRDGPPHPSTILHRTA